MAHAAELAMMDADPAVQATIFGKTFDAEQTLRRARLRVEQWDEHGFGEYVVRLPDRTFVGCAGLFRPATDPDAVALGYMLRPAFWGRGYATELAGAMVALGTGILRLRAIVAVALATNAASRRVLEKAGFTLSGADPDHPDVVRYRFVSRGGCGRARRA